MPELPEVETILRGIIPFIKAQKIRNIIIRRESLRWPIPKIQLQQLVGSRVKQLERRGKYLLLLTNLGTAIFHLGMSGRLQILHKQTKITKHDHIDFIFHNNYVLRFNDPRRFGALLWTNKNPNYHPLLKNLGIEPLTPKFNYLYLQPRLKNKKTSIKVALMNQLIVVGIGNIYANEALFIAGIHPNTSAKMLVPAQLKKLVAAIKLILRRAIKKGGSSIKDFTNSLGEPGYFNKEFQVYGRSKLPCFQCQTPLQEMSIAGRKTIFCNQCQPTIK